MMLVIVPGMVINGTQGETGSFLVIIFLFAVMLYFANVDWKILLGLALAAIIGILAIYGLAVASGSDSYRLQRILAFFDPEAYSSSDAYQQTQS